MGHDDTSGPVRIATEAEYRRDLESVHGWLRPECALLVSRLATAQETSGSVGEIGVHHGKFFILLSVLRRGTEAGVAVDLFEDQSHNVDRSGAGDRGIFEANLRRFGADKGISVQSADSTTVTEAQLLGWSGDRRFRLFSVDGGHTPEITANDLHLAAAVAADGGLVILDDYFNEAWPGVSEGANRFLATEPGLVGVGSAHGKTFFTTGTKHAATYRNVMRRVGLEQSWRISEQPFFGHPHVALVVAPRRRVVRSTAEAVARRAMRPVRDRLAGSKGA